MFLKKMFVNWGRLGLLLAVALAAAPAQAAFDFTGDFAPANWALQPDLGTVSFNGAQTELLLTGPSGLPVSQSSQDLAVYVGLGGQGASVAGTVSFNWSFNSGNALSAQAAVNWTGSAQPYTFASGGPGTITAGSYSVMLGQGDQFAFLLSTDNPGVKSGPAEFSITDFSFTIPEASTVWLGAGLLALLAASKAARRP